MAQSFKRSDSIIYIITKWFNELLTAQNEYNKTILLIFQTFKVAILKMLMDMQKLVEKKAEKELYQKKFEFIERIDMDEFPPP